MTKTTKILAAVLLLAGSFLFGSAPARLALAQEPETAPETESLPPVPAEHGSARATMRTFLEAFDPARSADGRAHPERAAACLEMSERERSLSGADLAVQLKDVLDRTRLVDFEKIPDAPGGPPYVFLRSAQGEVVIDRADGGRWLFTSETVAGLPALWRATESQEVVEGVTEAERTLGLWLRSKMPESLLTVTFLLEAWQWLGILVLVIVGVVVSRLVAAALHGVIVRWLRRGMRTVDEEILEGSTKPLGMLAMTLVWWVGLPWLNLPLEATSVLHGAISLVVAVSLVWAAYRLVDILTAFLAAKAEKTESKLDDLLVPLIRKSAKVFVTAFGLVFIAQNLGWQITSLLAGVGLGGLAFALAAQDTVKNLFGSLTVVLDRPFHVGDWVEIDGIEGTVAEVGIRSTRIRTFYDSLVTLPNSSLINASVDNYGARTYRRWSTILSVTYDTPPESIDAFCEGIRELIRRHPYTRKDSYQVYFREFGPASLDLILYTFFLCPDWGTELRERHRLGVDILRLARELGVEFAFPTQTLHLRRDPPAKPPALPEDPLYRERSAKLREKARKDARDLVAAGVGHGEVPPPVVIEPPKPVES